VARTTRTGALGCEGRRGHMQTLRQGVYTAPRAAERFATTVTRMS
jgi:hypothetical protein